MPPLHHEVVTATVRVEPTKAALARGEGDARGDAAGAGPRYGRRPGRLDQRRLGPAVLRPLRPRSGRGAPAGRSPRFEGRREAGARRHRRDPFPERSRGSRSSRRTTSPSFSAATAWTSSPTRLAELFDEAKGLFSITSIRRGFTGGGFDGGQSLPEADGDGGRDRRRRAHPRHGGALPRASPRRRRPASALRESRTSRRLPGYTEPVAGRVLPRRDGHAPLPPLRGHGGVVPQLRLSRARGYDLQARARRRGGDADGAPGRRGRGRIEGRRAGRRAIRRRRAQLGHAACLAPAGDVTGNDGILYPKGTAVPQRADFNTLDNPFFWSARPDVDGQSEEPAAGLHFVVFTPTSDDFHRTRLAMDGILPDGTSVPFIRARAGRASTRSCRRRTGRTSSSRRGATAPSRSPSCSS